VIEASGIAHPPVAYKPAVIHNAEHLVCIRVPGVVDTLTPNVSVVTGSVSAIK